MMDETYLESLVAGYYRDMRDPCEKPLLLVHAAVGDTVVHVSGDLEGHLATCRSCQGVWSDLQASGGLANLLTQGATAETRTAEQSHELSNGRILPFEPRGRRRFALGVIAGLAATALVYLAVGTEPSVVSEGPPEHHSTQGSFLARGDTELGFEMTVSSRVCQERAKEDGPCRWNSGSEPMMLYYRASRPHYIAAFILDADGDLSVLYAGPNGLSAGRVEPERDGDCARGQFCYLQGGLYRAPPGRATVWVLQSETRFGLSRARRLIAADMREAYSEKQGQVERQRTGGDSVQMWRFDLLVGP